jgi:hypothetical protein
MIARRWGWCAAALLLAGLSSGCQGSAGDTGIVVEVSTNLAVPAQADGFVVRVWDARQQMVQDLLFDLRAGGAVAQLPARMGLRPDDPSDARPVTIAAIAVSAGREILEQRAAVAFRRGRVLLLRLALLRECLSQLCAAGQTCEEGPSCGEITRNVNTLPVYAPRMPGGDGEAGGAGGAGSDAGAADARTSTWDGVTVWNPWPVRRPGALPSDGADSAPSDARDESDAMAADGAAMLPPAPPADGRPAPDAGGTAPDVAAAPDVTAAPDVAPVPVGPPRPAGQACSTAADCQTGFCVDRICCKAACGGTCMGCARATTGAPDGECAHILNGTDPHDECPTQAPESCGTEGTCDGGGHCRLYGPATRCGSPSCLSDAYVSAPSCDGHGQCVVPNPHDCDKYACFVNSGCATACQTAAECAATAYCKGSVCVARQATGKPCTTAVECLSGVCAAGLCL